MRIRLTHHASRRMSERHISEQDIQFVLTHVEMSMPGDKGAVKHMSHLPDGRYLAVVLIRPLDVSKINVVKTVHPVD